MSDAPELIEYVLQPIEADKGEIPVMQDGDPFIVDVRLTDLADGITIVAAPEETSLEVMRALGDHISKSRQAKTGQFFLVRGDISKWRAARLIRKDKWDADYREPA